MNIDTIIVTSHHPVRCPNCTSLAPLVMTDCWERTTTAYYYECHNCGIDFMNEQEVLSC